MNVNANMKIQQLMSEKKRLLWALLFLFLLSLSSGMVAAQQDSKQHVLILNSYHQGFSWTNRIVASINDVFAEAGTNAEVHIEYMDTKRLLNEDYLENLFNLYKSKYAKIPVDVIIVSDNNGLEFLRTYGEELFPETPIVFTGINNFSDELLNGFDQITGVAEETDIAATMELMLNLHPDTEQIYLLNDKTPTGVATLNSFEEVRTQFADQVEFVILDDFAVDEMQQELATLPDHSLILMLLVNRDNTGQFFSYEESLTALSQYTQVPIYGIWDFYIGYGIVGGKLTNGNSQGRAAGEMAVRILQGEAATDIPVLRDSPNQYMFDYDQLQRFDISPNQLPEESLIINKPASFYELYKNYIWTASIIFLVLVIAIVILLINIAQRRRAEKELQQSYIRRGRQVMLSTQVTQEITGINDLEDLYRNIVQKIKDQFGYYHTQILQYDPQKDAVRLVAGYGEIGSQMLAEGHQVSLGEGLIGRAAATGDTVLRATLSDDPDWKPNPLLPDTKGEMAVPIKLGTEIIGVLDVQSDQPDTLNQDDQLLLEGLCGQIAIALENARAISERQQLLGDAEAQARQLVQANQEAERRAQELQTVAEVSTTVAITLDQQQLLKQVVNLVKERFELYHAHIYLLDEAKEHLVLSAGAGAIGNQMVSEGRSIDVTAEQSLVARAAQTHQGVIVNDVHADPGFLGHPLLPDTCSEMAVPMIAGDQLLGVLDVQANEVNRFTNQDVQIQTTLAAQTAVALQNAALFGGRKQAEAELRYASELAGMASWTLDVPTLSFATNERFLKLLGMDGESSAGTPVDIGTFLERFVHPEDRARVQGQIANDLQQGDPDFRGRLEYRVIRGDGSLMHALVEYRFVFNDQNQPDTVYGSFLDITERRLAEKGIRERETLLRTIIDSTPDWIFVKDVNHRYLMVNQGYADSFHMNPDDFIGKNDLEIGFPEEIVKGDPEKGIRGFWADDREIMERGELKVIEMEPAVVDGEERWLNTIKAPLKDAAGDVTGIVGFVHDITDRIRIEEDVRERETLMRTIIDSTPDWIFVKDVNHRYLMVNQGYANSFHLNPEEFIGKNDLDIGFPEEIVKGDPEKGIRGFWADDREIMERGELKVIDVEPAVVDGEQRWLNTIKAPLKDAAGNVTGIVGFVHDITELQNIQTILSQRAAELETVASVGAVTATILEPDDLLQQVVELTKERFNLYHAHIYLLDEGKTELILTNGAGDVGQKMVAEGRRIALSQEKSLVARAARTQEGVVINDVQADPGFLRHVLLPETRAEMAVPLVVANEVQGVLDVQADIVDRFTTEDINIFTTLASQIAVSLQNVRSLRQSEQAVQELQDLSRRLTRDGWETYLAERADTLTFSYDRTQKTSRSQVANDTAGSSQQFTHMLQIQGEPIGKLHLEAPKQYGEDESELLTAVSERLSAHLENLRLAEASEKDRSAAEKRSQEMAVINNIVTQISTSLDLQHSLQVVVDEMVTAVNVDQVRVALIQPDQNNLLVIAEHFDSVRATSAVGMTIPIEGNELTQTVIETRKLVVVEDAQNNPRTAPVHDLFREQGIQTVILIPLVVNDEVIGTLGMDILDVRPVAEDSLKLAETIVYQTATAIQNARLFEQIQATLAETEMLYSYSSQLNTATSLDAVLDSAAAAGFQVGATDAVLLVYDRNTTGNPEYAQVAATAPRNEKRVGERLYLQEQPTRYLWPASGQNTVFVGNVSEDARLSPEDKETFAQQGLEALAIMYLNVGNLRLGQIVIHWDKAQTFTNTDERLYGAIAQQASSVVYNRLLFNQTEEALSETAALYQASADLNTAQTYDEVLTAMRQHTVLGQGSSIVAINYFNRVWEKDDKPEFVDVLARWSAKSAEQPLRHDLATFPEADILLQPNDWLVSDDIAADSRIGEETKQFFAKMFAAKSMIFFPLVVGNQWVGFINGLYPQPTSFSEEQLRRLNVLARQAAVTIQSIRLYEQTQEALAQTEALYTGSERIVLASTEEDILQSLIQSTELRRLDRASLFMFDHPVEDRVARDVTVVATWVNEGVPPSVQVGTRFEVVRVPFLSGVNPDQSLVINDIRNDPRVDEQTRQILESYGMISFVMVPIVVGSQWLGMVSGQSSVPMNMTEVQMRQANSLVGQAAVVMQTTILFRQEQARARREHLLREIAAKVRNSTDIDTIMQTAVTEIGRTLGRRSFIRLGNGQNGKEQADVDPLSLSQQENGAS